MSSVQHCVKDAVKNIFKSGCSPLGRTEVLAWSNTGFQFASQEAMKDLAVWNTAILNKDLYILSKPFGIEAADVAAVFVEGLSETIKVEGTKKRIDYTFKLPECINANLITWDQQNVTLFEITAADQYKGVINADGTVKGQDVSLSVDTMTTATGTENALSRVKVSYANAREFESNPATGILDFSSSVLQGVVDVNLTEFATSETSSLIKVRVTKECNGESVINLALGDLIVEDATGAAVVVSGSTYNAVDDVYELASAAAFANTDTVRTNGVLDQTTVFLESDQPALTITGI
jgi:hypothetical protein